MSIMKRCFIVPLFLILACSSDSEDVSTCPDQRCAPDESPLTCPQDCGPSTFSVPRAESSEVDRVLLFTAGGRAAKSVDVLNFLAQQESCALLEDQGPYGWHSGYFPTREPNTRLLPFWSYPSSCPLTEDPGDFQGQKARIRFELKSDGYYNINMWTPKLFELCAAEYESEDLTRTVPMMEYLHVVLRLDSDTPTPQLQTSKFFVQINTTREGLLRNIFEKIPLRRGEHELWVLDHSPNATECPSTGQNSAPDDEVFFVDGLYIEYLEPLQ